MKGKAIVNAKAEGEALVFQESFSFFEGVDPETGTIITPNNEHKGKRLSGKILVYRYAKGSTGDCLIIWGLANKNLAPAALISHKIDISVHSQGAIAANIPLICGFEKDPTGLIETGDYVRVDGEKVIVSKK